MKYIIIITAVLLSHTVHAGSLYTFTKHDIQLQALTWVKYRDNDLSKVELTPQNVSPYIKKNGEVEVHVYFTYKSNAESGFNYVCVHMNENGELLGFRKEIKVYKGKFGIFRPENSSCGTLRQALGA